MSNTDKQPQTVYIRKGDLDGQPDAVIFERTPFEEGLKEVENAYVFTKEELKVMLQNTWAISRAYFYEEEFGVTPNKFPDIDNYIKNILCG